MSAAPRDFGFGADEELVRDLARRFLDEQLPVEKLRKLVARDHRSVYDEGARPDWDTGLWKQIVELGWPGLAVPEAAGGLGTRLVGIAGLVEEIGRHALPSPYLATLLATEVAREAPPERAAAWLGRIADGTSASLAITDAQGTFEPRGTALQARQAGSALTLRGAAHFVQDAFKAEVVFASAWLGERLVLCAVPIDAPGLTLVQDHIHDLTRDQATLQFVDVRVEPEHVISEDAETALTRAWPALLVTVAADLCGVAEWQLQATVEYARNRKQFDHPLGFFQAVKHPLVNAMVEIDRARSLLYHAASAIDAGAPDAEVAARMAKSAASDAGAFISDRSVQLHGGIGFTWESDVHLFFKRSMHGQALFGDAVHHRRRLADLLI